MKLFRVQSMYIMTPMYIMYKDSHMEKFKRVMRHIKLISMNRRLFWMYLEMHKVVQSAVHDSMCIMTRLLTDRIAD
jgi:hypothetical protein